MSKYLKPVLALIISFLLFAGFMFLANTELLNIVQTRFYNPSVLNSYEKENAIDAEIVQNHIFELQNKFADTLTESAVRSSFLYSQSAEDIYERSRIFGILLESTGGLQSVRFVDSNGIRIHYSTSSRDIISQSQNTTAYRNYNEDPTALPYETVSVRANANAKFIMDEQNDRIIFSYPFIDAMEVYRGTAIFTVSVRALAERLIAEGRLKVNEVISVIRQPTGILFGSPEASKADINKKAAEIWKEGILGRVTLDSEESGVKFSLISLRTNRGIFFGRLVSDYLFSVSDSMKIILHLSMFLTFFLTVFFLINFKSSPITIVRNRIKHLREKVFEELYENKNNKDKTKWILELEQRRDEIRSELKRNIKLTRHNEKNINSVIDRSWDELLSIVKVGSGYVSLAPQEIPTVQQEEQKAHEAEEIEEAQALEEVESLEETETFEEEAEDIEEIEEVEAAENAEGIEALEEEAEDIEEIEELEDIVEVKLSHKGLLGLASKIETKTVKEAKPRHKGLLELASEVETKTIDSSKAVKKTKPRHKGLLELTSEIEVETEIIEELEEVEEIKVTKGLLARASEEAEEEDSATSQKGLSTLAREIEFSHSIGVKEDEEELDADLNIVSPFPSMFQSLDEKKKKKSSAQKKKRNTTKK